MTQQIQMSTIRVEIEIMKTTKENTLKLWWESFENATNRSSSTRYYSVEYEIMKVMTRLRMQQIQLDSKFLLILLAAYLNQLQRQATYIFCITKQQPTENILHQSQHHESSYNTIKNSLSIFEDTTWHSSHSTTIYSTERAYFPKDNPKVSCQY